MPSPMLTSISDQTSLPTAINNQIASISSIGQIVDDLVARGWSQQCDFLPPSVVLALAAECRTRADNGKLTAAGVGRGAGQAIRDGVRGDHIQWLEAGQSVDCDHYLRVMDTLRQELNLALYLGLDAYETHFALYPPGAFYQKHVDRFRDDDRRTVSVVLYLNQDWLPEHGGALRLYPEGEPPQDILPLAGSLALFMSGDMAHEVLPATRERLSLTGWFKRR